LSAVKIDQLAERAGIEAYSQRVDGEIPTVEVLLNGALLDRRQRRRIFVILRAGRSHIHLEPVRQEHNSRPESLVDLHPACPLLRQGACKRDPVALHHKIDIEVVDAEQQVTHKSTDHIC